jgi:cytochrome c biogenesis protein CcdA/thiol-disulfide isomerase/thioredoxin
VLLLTLFAFVAGAATALSPCVLPVLPIALAAGVTGGRRRPLGVVTGLALSFTFAVVALVYVISALGLPDDLLRTFAIAVLLVFGLSLLVPPAAARIEAWLSRFSARAPTATGDGYWSGLLVGAGLGFVYAPCAGPILAGVITVSASQPFSGGRLIVAFAYGLGSAVVLYALMLGGRRVTSRLARRSTAFQAAMGAVMVLVAAAMFANLDTRFETSIATRLPAFLVNPTSSLEKTSAARRGLDDVRGRRSGPDFTKVAAASAGGAPLAPPVAHPSKLPVLGAAPDFQGNQRWFNTPGNRPLTLAGLRGRVVLVDFWTYSCINCLRTLPYLKAWDATYRARGLTIVGVHSPEFPFEKSAANVEAAIRQNGLRYPVAQDNDLATWNAFGNQYWPAEYLIDTRGKVRFAAFGEGDDAKKERAIRSLLAERGDGSLGAVTHTVAQVASNAELTPESYLGSERAERFVPAAPAPGTHDFGPLSADAPPPGHLRYSGQWTIGRDSALAGAGAGLTLHFHARRVFLVLGAPGAARDVRVLLDGRPVPARAAGPDVRDGRARVGFQRLYRLLDLPKVRDGTLTVLPQAGVRGYAFTFG